MTAPAQKPEKLYGFSTGRHRFRLVSAEGDVLWNGFSVLSASRVGDAQRVAAEHAPDVEFEWVPREQRNTHEGLLLALGEGS